MPHVHSEAELGKGSTTLLVLTVCVRVCARVKVCEGVSVCECVCV